MKNLLTIAGSDSGGGAGIQADLKTFAAHGGHGMSVITAVTAQNTQTVSAVEELSPGIVIAQIDAVFADFHVDAVKTGMLSSAVLIHAIATRLRQHRPPILVLDPVMISKSGCALLPLVAVQALRQELLPLATLVTPNVPEAEALTGLTIATRSDMEAAARRLHEFGPAAVLIKGGHMPGERADDLLFDGQTMHWLPGQRLVSRNTHGTGCTLAAALTANLANGLSLLAAALAAKAYVARAMARGLDVGHGCGPLDHFVDGLPSRYEAPPKRSP